MENIVLSDPDDVMKQEQRTFLRERFLRLLAGLQGSAVKFEMHERTKVNGILGPADVDFAHVQVSELYTPMGVVPHAILRTSDILSMTITEQASDTAAQNTGQ